jgi:hypothetical protein
MEETKPKVNQSEEEFFNSPNVDTTKGPSINATVTFNGEADLEHSELLIRIPMSQLSYGNSRPTSKAGKRNFVVKGDLGREGLPGYITDSEGRKYSVTIANPNLNLFFSPLKG